MHIDQASHLYSKRFQGFNLKTGVPSAAAGEQAMADLVALAARSDLPADGRLRHLDHLVGEMAWMAPASAMLFEEAIIDNPKNRELAKALEIALTALDERSPETWLHIVHHTSLTMMHYERQTEIYKNDPPVPANPQELLTLLVGAIGHDFGKIGLDPKLLHKATRVEPERFAAALKSYNQLVPDYPEKLHDTIFLEEANKGSIIFAQPGDVSTVANPMILDIGKDLRRSEHYWLDNEQRKKHNAIWERINKHAQSIPGNQWLNATEQQALTMAERGTVTPEEKRVIASHDAMSAAFFAHAPLPADLVGVRDIVSMDGFRKGEAASPLADIIHTNDVFEALTADRCYRKAYSPEEAMVIMDGMGKEGKVSSAVVDSMRDSGTVNAYAKAIHLQHSLDISMSLAHAVEPSWVQKVSGFKSMVRSFGKNQGMLGI